MTDADIKTTFGRYSVRYALACYALDGNPLHLWTVWRVCRKAGIEVPPIVLDYMDNVAAELDPTSPQCQREGRIDRWVRTSVLGDSKMPAVKQAQLVQKALELSPQLDLTDIQVQSLAWQFHKEPRTVHRWLEKARNLIHPD